MTLTEYKRKRNFKQTPEPKGGKPRAGKDAQFVVQKHAASRLHYDFRLELDGTLRSWAVPKGPNLDPAVKALAVQVEDHPLDYASFEGVIPQGEYGGGTVMVWDRGPWRPTGDARTGLKKGKLTFQLFGEKLRGEWTLVRMHGKAAEDGKNWLLIKHQDEESRAGRKAEIVKTATKSVLSGREMDGIAGDADRVWTKNGEAKKTRGRSGQSGGSKVARAKSNALSTKRRASSSSVKKSEKASKKKSKAVAQHLDGTALSALPGARRAAMPQSFSPQLATLSSKMPPGDNWIHELKFDGYRILAFVESGRVKLVSRNNKDWTHRFGSVVSGLKGLPLERAILDGEMVALDEQGKSSFQRLQNNMRQGIAADLVYYAFDAPYLENYDLTATPLVDRKAQLARLLQPDGRSNNGVLRYSDHIQGYGDEVWQQACRAAMEGVVSKRADSRYIQARTRDWLKVKCLQRQEFVIGGYTKPSGSRVGFGALLLGYYADGELRFCGRVGTGFTNESLDELLTKMKAIRSERPAFVNPPRGAAARDVTWLDPRLVAEVEFTEWTDDDVLRHPSFQGLREDKPAKKVVRELPAQEVNGNMPNKKPRRTKTRSGSSTDGTRSTKPQERVDKAEPDIAGVYITHPERVLYPEQGITKRDLAQYYEQVADWILPHMVDRPLTLVRCPGGRAGQCFYQKHIAGARPVGVRGVMIKEKEKREEYVVIDDLSGLVSLVQMGVLEIHPWPARADKVERPDRLVVDFDPGEGVEWKEVVRAAREARARLESLGLKSFVRTTGGKGLHVVVPFARRIDWESFKAFAKSFADAMVRSEPNRYIATMSKAKRRGKIFVDYLRNQRGATAIANYSTRSRPGAPVATPLAWDELSARMQATSFDVFSVPKRLARMSADPWDGFLSLQQSITSAMRKSLDAS